MIPAFLRRIARKIARRTRVKGTDAIRRSRPGRNFYGRTAVDLWQRSFAFKETPAARAGVKRRLAREKALRRKKGLLSLWL